MSRLRPVGGPRYAVEVVRDVRIPIPGPASAPAGTLAADLYLPVVGRPVPLLLTALPYRKDFIAGVAHDTPGRWFAARGYASLLLDLSGTGSSDGPRRPEFDPGDGEDAVAAIDWATAQPWCDGAVGMWGHSYGAITTLRTASLQPPALRAIIPLMHGLDPEVDTVHPDGARGDLHALANRGTSMLVQQLLPPLINHNSTSEQQRWQHRLHRTEPVLLDFARHGPGDPVWRERAIDGAAVVVPALCVGGWRDAFPDALISAYERIGGPSKLLMGPWGHVMPQNAAVEPIDFLSLALRWWDHWLRGQDNGVMDEPPVTLYQQGARPSWRAYPSWPPADGSLQLATGGDTVLRAPPTDRGPAGAAGPLGPPIAVYRPDPTVGSLRGVPGLGLGEACLTQDQHDDDMRSALVCSDPLAEDLVIGGRPQVVVTLAPAPDSAGGTVRRLVVRLAEVGPGGRSTLITVGVLCPPPDPAADAAADAAARYCVTLRPIVHRVPAGQRLLVAVCDSDFPRLTPLGGPPVELRITGVELSVPTLSATAGLPVELPALPTPAPAPPPGLSWTITRDPVHDGISVSVSSSSSGTTVDQGHRFQAGNSLLASVRRAEPDAAVTVGTHRATVSMSSGESVTTTATVRCTQTALWASGEVTVDDVTVFSQVWEASMAQPAEAAPVTPAPAAAPGSVTAPESAAAPLPPP